MGGGEGRDGVLACLWIWGKWQAGGFFLWGGGGNAVVDKVASYCWRLGLGIVLVGTLGKGKRDVEEDFEALMATNIRTVVTGGDESSQSR